MIVRIQSAANLRAGIYYEYESESIPLGQGGMGTVYQGYCFREGDRSQYIPVAVKRIGSSTPDLVNRAMREASVQVDHENLLMMWDFIPSYEIDQSTGANVIRHYIIMDCLQGVNLDNLINGYFMDKFNNECLYAKELYQLYMTDRYSFVRLIMSNVLNGVKALHDAGFIHRDLDPSNVMITHEKQIKIIDYGISKKIDDSTGITQKLTATGSMMGKTDYAAPEMITGDVNHHGKFTDIYALGIMAYQLSVGALPFQGSAGVVAKSQLDTPVPVDNISDPVIRQIVKKASAKAPQDRYQDISEILQDFKMLTERFGQEDYEREFRKLSNSSGVEELKDFLVRYPTGKHTENVIKMISKKEKDDTKTGGDIAVWAWIIFPLIGVAIGVVMNMFIL